MLFGKRLNKYYIKHFVPYVIGIVFLLLVDYVQTLLPRQVALIYGGVEDGSLTVELLKRIAITIIIYGLIMAISRFFWRMFLIGSARKIETELKNEMFEHSQKLSQEFYSKQKVGAMMSLYTADVDTIRQSLGFGVVMFIDAVFLGLVALIKMLMVDVSLTIVALIPMLIIAIGGFWFSKSLEKAYSGRQEAIEGMSEFVQENFSGISVIKAYVKERREFREFIRRNKNVYSASLKFSRKIAWLETLIETLISLSIVFIFALGGYFVAVKGSLSGADLVEFYQLFFLLIWTMIALAQIINNLSQGKASLKRITNYLNEPYTVFDSKDVLDVQALNGTVKFNNLTFRYPETDIDVLKNVSFEIKNGEMVGIIGRTGSGKSCIVELILRTYNVEKESLFIDGYDIMQLPIKTVRNNIGYVPQNNFLYSDTIHNNISFGLDQNTVSRESVEEYAQLADIHKNISEFVSGYDTIVGERGTTLSGGQKQRISIARALIKDPNILVLDDSVSAVDTATEVNILKNLRKIRKNKTTIIIGHRISTMKNMNKVILIDDGKIVAIGKHDDLAANCELYQEMIKAQELED